MTAHNRAIRLSWLCFVYPCLMVSVSFRWFDTIHWTSLTLNEKYIGQGAHISVKPSAYANPFFLTVPPGMLYPSLVMAILACIVASQAVITGSFQVCHPFP